MTEEPTLSERLLDMQHRRVNRWSHVDQCTVGNAIWALRSLEAIADAYTAERSNLASIGRPLTRGQALKQWFPTLANLLDALTEE